MSVKTEVKGPKYQIVDGFKYSPKLPAENIRSGLKYKPNDSDLFVVTYMKSGTTWTQQICTLIYNDGNESKELTENGLFNVSPFLEWVGSEGVQSMPDPKIIKTHLPFHLQPYNPKAKYIYVARNPKDVLVSFCHHLHLFPDYHFLGNVHDLLPYFLKGDIDFGSWSDHIISWWQHRDDDNVLFMLYEDMKSNIKEAILKIASFMGNEYRRKLDENPNVLEKVIHLSDISHMKQTTNKDFEKLWDGMGILFENRDFNFVRKGIIGDWRNEICAEDNAVLEKWFEDTFKNSGVYNLWDKYDVFDHKQKQ